MKRYAQPSLISSFYSAEFNSELYRVIEGYQKRGYEVEVQYKLVFMKSSERFSIPLWFLHIEMSDCNVLEMVS